MQEVVKAALVAVKAEEVEQVGRGRGVGERAVAEGTKARHAAGGGTLHLAALPLIHFHVMMPCTLLYWQYNTARGVLLCQ